MLVEEVEPRGREAPHLLGRQHLGREGFDGDPHPIPAVLVLVLPKDGKAPVPSGGRAALDDVHGVGSHAVGRVLDRSLGEADRAGENAPKDVVLPATRTAPFRKRCAKRAFL
eukprot:scaffold7044_cov216-Pinguiococcus_pyrenoidosus.AAC.8